MANSKQSSTERIVEILEHWQDAENRTVAQTTAIIGKSANPLVKLVMDIIRHDSIMHHKVQQFIIDSLTVKAISLTPEELGEIWEMVEKHIAMERETIGYGDELTKLCKLFVQSHLLNYLLTDENKHEKMLTQLEDFKRKLYPYA
jgi:hypothetical protein